jgi:phage terminase large subunit-like protein
MAVAEWNFACPDWEQRLAAGNSLIPDLPLDRKLADKAVAIFNRLRLPDVAGNPALAEAAGDWQRDIVAALFGSVVGKHRMVKRPFVLVPKKNSKTTGAAAIMLTALLMDEAPRQSYLLYGPTQAIAQRGFEQAAGMIKADPFLSERFHIREHLKTIVDLVTESTLKVQTFDSSVATGVIPKGMLVDELHELGSVHYAQRVLGQLWGGLVSKPDGFMMFITTQSDQPPAGVFKAELDLARGIRDGRITGKAATTLPILYEFPEKVQSDPAQPWRNPALWPQVLPNLGRSAQIEMLEAQFAEACEKDAAELARWASQHLNIEIGMGLHSQRWRGADHWAANAVEGGLTLEQLLERCEVAVVGIDGGGLDDLLGLAVVGRETGTGHWLAWARAWCVRDVLELRKDIAPRLLQFEAEGTLTLCDTATQDLEEVAALVGQVLESGLLPEKDAIGLDPLAVGGLIDALVGVGIEDDQLTAIGQGFRLSSAVWSAERKLRDGTLEHDGSALFTWCVGNAKAEQKGNAVYITKEVAGKAKIDPLIAMFNAVKLMERNPEAGGNRKSVYEERGLLVL